MAAKKKIKWACPKCGAEPEKHGRGGIDECIERTATEKSCQGFLCECGWGEDDDGTVAPNERVDHGETQDNPCTNAVCYHCGWDGIFPPPPVDVKKLKGWAKTAWDAGWRPPTGWKPGR